MTTLELLKAARNTISTPDKWTQRVSARSSNGTPVAADSLRATCFCMLGALWHHEPDLDRSETARGELLRTLDHFSVSAFNDEEGRTHAEVLKAFDKTIARLEEAQ